jgi:formylglycine-generating enzyme required for sulfatase activity
MIDGQRKPPERYEAGLQLDALKWLPPDLNEWVRCPACADNRQDLYVQKYLVTNQQFELFIKAGGYDNPTWWGGEKSTAWLWRVKEHGDYRGNEPVSEPRYWQSDDFGRARRGFPVVGVSWYEAMAYAAWLTDLLRRARAQDETLTVEERQLIEPLRETGGQTITLPTETEWVRLAGGDAQNRYPWDKPGQPVTTDVTEITRRTNVSEGKIGKTSPVSMYPQGASHPFALMDVAGNVWEWTNSLYQEGSSRRVVRGGSWDGAHGGARVGVRNLNSPDFSDYDFGFRLVSPIGSGS